jgi:stage V sporulation protein S
VGQVELQAIGAGAINQAVKATAIARSYLQEERIDLWCIPAFIELVIDGEERTALRLVIEVQR